MALYALRFPACLLCPPPHSLPSELHSVCSCGLSCNNFLSASIRELGVDVSDARLVFTDISYISEPFALRGSKGCLLAPIEQMLQRAPKKKSVSLPQISRSTCLVALAQSKLAAMEPNEKRRAIKTAAIRTVRQTICAAHIARFRTPTKSGTENYAANLRNTFGSSSAIRISVFAAAEGSRRPCSQSCNVRTDTPSSAANCSCVSPDFSRARRIGYDAVVNLRPIRPDLIARMPSRISWPTSRELTRFADLATFDLRILDALFDSP